MYERPAERWVAGFLGEVNLFERPPGWLAVRPERMRLAAGPEGPGALAGTVEAVGFLGDWTTWLVRLDSGQTVKVAAANTGATPLFDRGQRVFAAFDPAAAVALDR